MAKPSYTLAILGAVAATGLVLALGTSSKPSKPKPQPKNPGGIQGGGQISQPVAVSYGATPTALAALFKKAEAAAKIPGLGVFLAALAYDSWRANKSEITQPQIVNLSKENPNWDALSRDSSASAVAASTTALLNVPASWPPAQFKAEWAAFGSGGLFHLIAGANLYATYLDDFGPPMLKQTAEVGMGSKANAVGMVTSRVRRALLEPTTIRPTAEETWRRVYSYIRGVEPISAEADRFVKRAAFLGVKFNNPSISDNAKWPGAEKFWAGIA